MSFANVALKSSLRSLSTGELESLFSLFKEDFNDDVDLSSKMISYKW